MRLRFACVLVVLSFCVHQLLGAISKETKSRFPDVKDIGVFWQITDPHIDLEYKVGTPTECDVPLCCRVNTTASRNRPFKTDGGLESTAALPLATLGANCDIDHSMWRQSLEWVRSTFSKDQADFIVAGGDWIHHADWMQVPEDFVTYAKLITNDFLEVFGKDLPIYPIIGNHDGSNAVNIMPYSGEHKERLLKELEQLWGSAWIHEPEARKTLRDWGYYSVLIPTTIGEGQQKIRIVSLNSQWVNPLNFYVYSSKTDLAMNLEWISSVFNQSRANGEKIFISGHIPPGMKRGSASQETLNFWNAGLEKLLVEYGDIVIGSVYGHTHHDDFGIFHDYSTNPPRPTLVAFTAPALTPFGGGYYPAVRKFYYDKSTGSLLDFETYYNNMTKFHIEGGDFNNYWSLEYSAKQAYGLENLSPSEIQQKIYDPLWKNDAKTWNTFGRYYYVLNGQVCGGSNECKKKHLCSMGHLNLFNYFDCMEKPWPSKA